MKRRRIWMIVLIVFAGLAVAGGAINLCVVRTGGARISDSPEELATERYDAVIVLGARVYPDGSLSPRLKDRVEQGVRAVEAGLAGIIILSGDGREEANEEPEAMKRYCIERGIGEDKIITDPEGFSTFKTALNASEVYGLRRVLLVTQRYHLYRTVYTAEKLGLEAYGLSSDLREKYTDELWQTVRESAARVKAVLELFFY